MEDILLQTQNILQKWPNRPECCQVNSFSDGAALLRAHKETPFDILLLDVVMPQHSGIDIAREIRQTDRAVKIVFLTSSSEYAVESYTVKADNYLLKPLAPTRLYSCLDELYRNILNNSRRLVVKGANAVHRILFQDIEYVESQNKQVLLYLSNGSSLCTTVPLYTLEPQFLPEEGFFKCHRSYIVNFHRIDSYTQKEILMRSGCRIPISRGCHKEFETAYFAFLFGKVGDL